MPEDRFRIEPERGAILFCCRIGIAQGAQRVSEIDTRIDKIGTAGNQDAVCVPAPFEFSAVLEQPGQIVLRQVEIAPRAQRLAVLLLGGREVPCLVCEKSEVVVRFRVAGVQPGCAPETGRRARRVVLDHPEYAQVVVALGVVRSQFAHALVARRGVVQFT